MSDFKSPSPSRHPNTDTANTSSIPSLSRQDLYTATGPSNAQEDQNTTPSRRPHSFTYRDYPENTGLRSSSHPRPHYAAPEQPPSKKMHRQDSEDRVDESAGRSNTPSGSSQSGIEDNETEADRSQRSEASPAPTTFAFAVPKKKRTRTLTTPHQAAVLHALLAQSRFPTTAMREEVGKKIGLSARKVQIWFQNQRQKAKRPPTQGAAAPNQPTLLGQIVPVPGPSTSSPPIEFYTPPPDPNVGHASSSRHPEHPWASGQRRRGLDGRFLPPEDTPQSLTPGFWLSGPGMPGSSQNIQQHPSAGTRLPSMPHPHASPQLLSPHDPADPHHRTPFRRHSQSPPRMASQPSLLNLSINDTRDRPFNRTLPPLIFDASYSRGSLSPSSPSSYHLPPVTRSAPSNIPNFDIPSRSTSHQQHQQQHHYTTDSPFAHHAPEQRIPRDIPAPFALQPQPQWDTNSPYSSHSRPSTSSWSRPSTSYSTSGDGSGSSHTIRSHERVVEDLVARQQREEEANTSRPSPISRRFDPVYDSVSSNGRNRCSDA